MRKYTKDDTRWFADIYTDALRWERRRVYVEDNLLYVIKSGKYENLHTLQAQGMASKEYTL